MNLNIQSDANSFKGKIVIRDFNEKGKETVKHYTTTLVQDKLIQNVANSMTPKDYFNNRLNLENARVFKELIELLIKKPIKESGQPKLMDNISNSAINYSDIEPGRNGIFVSIKI